MYCWMAKADKVYEFRNPVEERFVNERGTLIPQHGGYRSNLKSFQIAQLVYDVTRAVLRPVH